MSRKDRVSSDITLWRTLLLVFGGGFVSLSIYLFKAISNDTLLRFEFEICVALLVILFWFSCESWNKHQSLSDELEDLED